MHDVIAPVTGYRSDVAADLLSGFSTVRLSGAGAEVFGRIRGNGPPLLLLHGYPQTHVAWCHIADALSHRFTVVVVDLRGYGGSGAPPIDGDASAYSKRAMAADLTAAMAELGFHRFRIAGHDRGARVAYRLAIDAPDRVERLAVLSVLPTYAMWRKLTDPNYAMKAFRWFMLAQPAPLPQNLIAAMGVPYLHHTLASWTKAYSLQPFSEAALRAYEHAFTTGSYIAASCADYRAGWTIDRHHDDDDLRHGRTIACPTLVLWGRSEFPDEAEMLSAWHEIAPVAAGQALDCGHFLMEERPEETTAILSGFFG